MGLSCDRFFVSFYANTFKRSQKNDRSKKERQETVDWLGRAGGIDCGIRNPVFHVPARNHPGAKSITIEVVDNHGDSTMYDVRTDAEYLRQAMEEAQGLEFSGSESEYGMMVDTVNGVTADWNVDQSYWGFFVNGEYCNYGIETQPVTDGDAFQIIYSK